MVNFFKKVIMSFILLLFSISIAFAIGNNMIKEETFNFGRNKYYVGVVSNLIDGSKDLIIGKYQLVESIIPATRKEEKETAFFVLSKILSDLGYAPKDNFTKIVILDKYYFSNAVRIEIQCYWNGGSDTYFIYYSGDKVKIAKHVYLSKKNVNQSIKDKSEKQVEKIIKNNDKEESSQKFDKHSELLGKN
jgi:hypothetical protein